MHVLTLTGALLALMRRCIQVVDGPSGQGPDSARRTRVAAVGKAMYGCAWRTTDGYCAR